MQNNPEQECKFFNSASGCFRGALCRFPHGDRKQENSIDTTPIIDQSATSPPPSTPLPGPCKFFLKGYCKSGDACPYSHSTTVTSTTPTSSPLQIALSLPSLDDNSSPSSSANLTFNDDEVEELVNLTYMQLELQQSGNIVQEKKKTATCRYFLKGYCKEGDSCAFIHHVDKLSIPMNTNKNFLKFGYEEEIGNPICLKCGNPSISRCSKCHLATYCGRECQVSHWTVKHKRECMSKKNFYCVLIDSYRLRVDEEYIFMNITRGLYHQENPLIDFKKYLGKAKRRNALPEWWTTPEDDEEVLKIALYDQIFNINYVVQVQSLMQSYGFGFENLQAIGQAVEGTTVIKNGY